MRIWFIRPRSLPWDIVLGQSNTEQTRIAESLELSGEDGGDFARAGLILWDEKNIRAGVNLVLQPNSSSINVVFF